MSAKSDAERAKAYRDRKRGQEPRTPKPCGTIAAARRHERAGEPPCSSCATARREYNRQAAARHRQKAGRS